MKLKKSKSPVTPGGQRRGHRRRYVLLKVCFGVGLIMEYGTTKQGNVGSMGLVYFPTSIWWSLLW